MLNENLGERCVQIAEEVKNVSRDCYGEGEEGGFQNSFYKEKVS